MPNHTRLWILAPALLLLSIAVWGWSVGAQDTTSVYLPLVYNAETPGATLTPSPSVTSSPSPTPSVTASATITSTATEIPTATPTATIEPTATPTGTPVYELAYESSMNLYTIRTDSSIPSLLAGLAVDTEPASWSPDGSQLAFVGEQALNQDLYVIGADGTGKTRLTNDDSFNYGPVWSPDGRSILYTRSHG